MLNNKLMQLKKNSIGQKIIQYRQLLPKIKLSKATRYYPKIEFLNL